MASTENRNVPVRNDAGALAGLRARSATDAPCDRASPPRVAIPSPPACASQCQIRRETDHRVANQLAMLASYVRLKSAELDRPDAITPGSMRLLTQGIEAQIHAVARLHRLLMSQDNAGDVDLAPLLREMCAAFRGGAQNAMLIEDLAPDCFVTTDQVLPMCQLVGEAIINAMKYAVSPSAKGVLVVRSQRTSLGGVSVGVMDNGPGLPPGFNPERDGGFGFTLMRNVSQAMGAPLVVETSPRGLHVGVVLPASAA